MSGGPDAPPEEPPADEPRAEEPRSDESPTGPAAYPADLVGVRLGPDTPRPGVADAHGVVAMLCGVGVLGTTCVCCIDPIRDDGIAAFAALLAVGGLWSGLFGVVTHGTRAGHALAGVGVGAIALSSVLLCFGATFGNMF